MNPAFQKTFEDSLKRQMAQNEEARKSLEGFLSGLRERTEQLMTQGSPRTQPYSPLNPGIMPETTRTNEPPAADRPLNEVSVDWVRTVTQAASLDLGFLQDVGNRASQIVMATLQLRPVKPDVTEEVSPAADSG